MYKSIKSGVNNVLIKKHFNSSLNDLCFHFKICFDLDKLPIPILYIKVSKSNRGIVITKNA